MRTLQIPTLSLLLFLATLPAAAQKIHIDYDGATAFSEYKTFAFKETGKDMRRVSSSLHARLQACQAGSAPVLIRIETAGGHGAGTPTSKRLDAVADRYAFLARNLRMKLPSRYR